MLSLAAAMARVLDGVAALEGVEVELDLAHGSVLRDDLVARLAAPPFDASAMDGFALRAADVVAAPVELRVIGTSSCGHPWSGVVRPGAAVRILTGAVVPEGADAVVPVERTDGGAGGTDRAGGAGGDDNDGSAGGDDRVVVHEPVAAGASIRRAGEVTTPGDVLVAAGTVLHGGHLALAASDGVERVTVTRAPRVAVVSTGDELIAPGTGPLRAGQIHDSNGTLMAELARSTGAEVTRHHAGDDPELLRGVLDELAAEADVVLTSGGVSMGAEFDPLRAAVAAHPVEFVRVAIKPAKPLAFGRLGDAGSAGAWYLGLPGNPVSVLVAFELFGRPLLDVLRGLPARSPRTTTGTAADAFELSDDGRTHLLPVRRGDDGRWTRTELAGSHALPGAASADALAVLGPEQRVVEAGDQLVLLPLWH